MEMDRGMSWTVTQKQLSWGGPSDMLSMETQWGSALYFHMDQQAASR